MGADGEWTYRCNRCNHWLPKSEFHSDKSKIFEIAYTCKECRKNSENEKPFVQDWEEEEGRRVLKELGYNINEDIFPQFAKRVKLRYGVALD